MGIFDGANDAPVGGNRIYCEPGRYLLKIDVIKAIAAHESFHGKTSFIVEAIVEASDVARLPQGATPSWVQSIKPQTKRTAYAAIKQFFAALYGDTTGEKLQAELARMPAPDGTTGQTFEQHLEVATSEANPYRGHHIELVCYEKILRPTTENPQGRPFTIHDWKPVGTIDWKAAS